MGSHVARGKLRGGSRSWGLQRRNACRDKSFSWLPRLSPVVGGSRQVDLDELVRTSLAYFWPLSAQQANFGGVLLPLLSKSWQRKACCYPRSNLFTAFLSSRPCPRCPIQATQAQQPQWIQKLSPAWQRSVLQQVCRARIYHLVDDL